MVMMRGIVGALEKHHNVRILDEGVDVGGEACRTATSPGRQLPDKAVSVLDTACARLALGQNSIPAQLENAKRRLDDLHVQERVLTREAASGADHAERLAAIAKETAETQQTLVELEARFDKERDLVIKIRELRGKIEGRCRLRPRPLRRQRRCSGARHRQPARPTSEAYGPN